SLTSQGSQSESRSETSQSNGRKAPLTDRQHDIAAYFGINGGRIAEISTGQTGSSITGDDPSDLATFRMRIKS
ncbi:hypothetical protein JQ640_45705, partial [Bradyrhizobium diazoefficiens]|nr:hypothetical protein [Bradyrhizobium diazoefficiens]